MLDIHETAADRRPTVLVCAFETDDPVWEGLDHAHSANARLRLVAAAEPDALAQAIAGELLDSDCRAVLLVGRTRKSDGFLVQMRAENRALTGGGKLAQTGPGTARATAPVADMVRALHQAGLAAAATSDSEEDAGSYLLYRVLTALPDDVDAPSIGLLRASGSLDPDHILLGLQAAAAAMARHLSPLPRHRPG
jgi:hypothetical protein